MWKVLLFNRNIWNVIIIAVSHYLNLSQLEILNFHGDHFLRLIFSKYFQRTNKKISDSK